MCLDSLHIKSAMEAAEVFITQALTDRFVDHQPCLQRRNLSQPRNIEQRINDAMLLDKAQDASRVLADSKEFHIL